MVGQTNRRNLITRRSFAAIGLASLIGYLGSRQLAAESRRQVESALQRLASVEIFAIGPVGYAGVTSPGEKDFRLLLAEPASLAVARFEDLYRRGNNQARCYALFALRDLDPKGFPSLYQPLQTSTEEVSVMSGCILSTEKLAEVARRIRDRESV